jgi:hypothetical protein
MLVVQLLDQFADPIGLPIAGWPEPGQEKEHQQARDVPEESAVLQGHPLSTVSTQAVLLHQTPSLIAPPISRSLANGLGDKGR